ncbi:hypothetical protein CRE_08864 [Caenorhabditis remanei]|uniref:Serpentine Receptor, class H n=1 Tax=Caenorhabditis remanei TaxID=31234 RepID=E3LHY4_CAERE|nr:hypothetical protein CRE_08864 [Caenorhabditis remanei]
MNYFNTSDFLSSFYNIIIFIEIPIHLFGAYCILFKTPPVMRSIKWSMLNLLVWSVLLDLTYSISLRPFMLWPAVAVYPMGLLSYLEIPTNFQFYVLYSVFYCLGVSIVSILENRYYLLFKQNTYWRRVRIPFLLMNYLTGPIFFSLFFITPMNQELALKTVQNVLAKMYFHNNVILQKFSNIPPLFQFNSIFVIDSQVGYLFKSVLVLGATVLVEKFLFSYLLIANLQRSARTLRLSRTTIAVQRKFLRAILIQIIIPILILVSPMFYIGPAILLQIYIQALNNFCVITFSLHGFVNTFVMLCIHEPYWRFIVKVSHWNCLFSRHSTAPTNTNYLSSAADFGAGRSRYGQLQKF